MPPVFAVPHRSIIFSIEFASCVPAERAGWEHATYEHTFGTLTCGEGHAAHDRTFGAVTSMIH